MKMIENWSFKKKFLIAFWGVISVGIVFIFLIFWMIVKGWIGYLPPTEELLNPKNHFATEVISSDLQHLGHYYRHENRVEVDYVDISPYMINALIATEDVRFYNHPGVDMKSLFRAILMLGKAGGGSTLTQQLAKQLWSPRANNVFERALQKPIEWVIATQLENLYSKEEIITMYLNQFDFLYNAVGIKSAAQVYFSTTPDKLKLEEAAMLVGMCKNPSLYNPRRRPEKACNRRNTVLNQMCKYDFITPEVCDSIKALPLELKYTSVDHKQGLAPYFREYLRGILTATEPHPDNYSEWNKWQYEVDKEEWEKNPLYGFCNKNHKSDGTPYNLYQDGLRIYTTIDSRMQQYAEESVSEHIRMLQEEFFKEKQGKSYAPFSRKLKPDEIDNIMLRSMRQSERYRNHKKKGMSEEEILKAFNTPREMQVFSYDGLIDTVISPMDSIRWNKYFLRCGFMSMDARSGAVKAYVGGPNFEYFQYDMVSIGRRQVGSTVKPFLYTLAMDEGMWPCDSTVNDTISLLTATGKRWSPRDSHKKNQGEMVSLAWGLAQSSNWITAYLMSLFTPEQMVKMMRSFGITGPLDPVVSLCLGPCEISVSEMVEAFSTFPNIGLRIEPLLVTHIEDRNGNLLATFSPRTHEVISPLTSYKMLHMLCGVMDHGTGVRARIRYGLRAPLGGKTGTTQNNSDGWFLGFTPTLVSGAWVGGEERSIHFDRMAIGQGANMSLPIWAMYMKKVYADTTLSYDQNEKFSIPRWFKANEGCIHEDLPEGAEATVEPVAKAGE